MELKSRANTSDSRAPASASNLSPNCCCTTVELAPETGHRQICLLLLGSIHSTHTWHWCPHFNFFSLASKENYFSAPWQWAPLRLCQSPKWSEGSKERPEAEKATGTTPSWPWGHLSVDNPFLDHPSVAREEDDIAQEARGTLVPRKGPFLVPLCLLLPLTCWAKLTDPDVHLATLW